MDSSLSSDSKCIVAAIIEGRVVSHLEKAELSTKLLQLINKIHANCGQIIDGQMVSSTLNDLVALILKDYSRLSFSEIEIAFQNGWTNVYGDYFGLNNKTYLSWIKCYFESKERTDAKKAIQKAQEPVIDTPTLSEADQDKLNFDALNLIFTRMKEGKSIVPIPAFFYDFLARKLVLNFTTERKLAFQKKAINEITAEKVEIKRSNSLKKLEIDEYIANMKPGGHEVINRAKSIAVKTYFEELIEIGEDFNFIFENNDH